MRAMSVPKNDNAKGGAPASARRLVNLYMQGLAWYFLMMVLFWVLGVEALYAHPTPFYAMFEPVFGAGPALPAAGLVMLTGAYVLRRTFFPGAPRFHWERTLWVGLSGVLMAGILGGLALNTQLDLGLLAASITNSWLSLRWHLVVLPAFFLFFALWLAASPQILRAEEPPSPRTQALMLAGLIAFSVLFACAVAMVRGGADALAAPFERHTMEYIGDIGVGGSIKGLFATYNDVHANLSMHSKVHPPGPVALLWLISYVTLSRDALPMALGTAMFGALAIIPLFLWVRDLCNARVAWVCASLYACMPSIVLFTAVSADIAFMPFTLTTLFLFWRAIHRPSALYALAAGIGYGFMSFLSFSLLTVGAFFGFVGLWRLTQAGRRWAVVQTAALMLGAFLGLHLAVRWWSGFDIIECFVLSKRQFDLDQYYLDQQTPRYPAWTWRFFNPLCWVYFAGIPVSILFFWRLVRPERETRGLFIVFALTLVVLTALYLARGEGERSAMYVLPFIVIPAAHCLVSLAGEERPMPHYAVTLGFLAFQCWLTESLFYTYW
jgi:hypothetical protein